MLCAYRLKLLFSTKTDRLLYYNFIGGGCYYVVFFLAVYCSGSQQHTLEFKVNIKMVCSYN